MPTCKPAARCRTLLLVTAVLAGASVTAMAGSQGGPAAVPERRAPEHDGRGDHRALSDAVRRVERATGGEVLSAERVPFDGRDVSRVKVVDASGRVRVYMDDPQGARARPQRPERPRTRGNDGNSD